MLETPAFNPRDEVHHFIHRHGTHQARANFHFNDRQSATLSKT